MNMEIKDFKSQINKVKGKRSKLLDYSDAFKEINAEITSSQDLEKIDLTISKEKNTKEAYRQIKEKYAEKIREAIRKLDISVSGYEDMNQFVEDLAENYCGYHILSAAFKDDEITDIFVVNKDYIFAEKKGENIRLTRPDGSPLAFKSSKDLEDTIDRFLQYDSKNINSGENKIVDSTLFGDRLCSIHPSIATKGYSITIRKHQEDHITRQNLIDWETITPEIADFFDLVIDGELNLICGGITGSGKTTSIRAISEYTFSKNKKRVLVCEDTAELNYHAEHVLALQSYKSDDEKLRVPLMDLIYTALRQKPKYIVVGEVRGEEAIAAIEGMETGHSTIITMHGGVIWNIINRLVTKYIMGMPSLGIEVVERIIGSAVDYVFIQDNIPGTGRRITSCAEISYDFEKRKIVVKDIFKWDFKTSSYKMMGKISEEKADTMLRRGVQYERIEKWLEKKEE